MAILVLKPKSEARWSAKAVVVNAIKTYLEQTLKLLRDMIEQKNGTGKNKKWLKAVAALHADLKFLYFARILYKSVHLRWPYIKKAAGRLAWVFATLPRAWKSSEIFPWFSLCEAWNAQFKRRWTWKKLMPGENLRVKNWTTAATLMDTSCMQKYWIVVVMLL